MPNGAHTTPMDGSTAAWALHTPTGEVGQRGSCLPPPARLALGLGFARALNQSADVDCARESLDQDSRNSWRKGKCATQG